MEVVDSMKNSPYLCSRIEIPFGNASWNQKKVWKKETGPSRATPISTTETWCNVDDDRNVLRYALGVGQRSTMRKQVLDKGKMVYAPFNTICSRSVARRSGKTLNTLDVIRLYDMGREMDPPWTVTRFFRTFTWPFGNQRSILVIPFKYYSGVNRSALKKTTVIIESHPLLRLV